MNCGRSAAVYRLGPVMAAVVQVEALTMAHRIMVMKDGVIQQIADPRTLYDQPVNRAQRLGGPVKEEF